MQFFLIVDFVVNYFLPITIYYVLLNVVYNFVQVGSNSIFFCTFFLFLTLPVFLMHPLNLKILLKLDLAILELLLLNIFLYDVLSSLLTLLDLLYAYFGLTSLIGLCFLILKEYFLYLSTW